jgi:adenosine/AMP kinase
MAFTEQNVIDKIEVIRDGSLQIRQAYTVLKDGVAVCEPSFSRWVRHPGDDVSDQDQRVQAIAAATWTPDVVAAYQKLAKGA